MPDISDLDRPKLTRTIDDLGIQTSKNYAQAEQLKRETDKYIKPSRYGRLSTEEESLKPTPTASEKLLGNTSQGRYALFPDQPENFTKITAFSEGRLSSTIGEEDLINKIKNAPEELKKNKEEYTLISLFAEQYKSTDKDCLFIHSRCKQYNKG